MVEESKQSVTKRISVPLFRQQNSTNQHEEDDELMAELTHQLMPVMQRRSSSVGNASRRSQVNKPGKALSLEHARRMAEHAKINTVVSYKMRSKAVGTTGDFPEDVMAIYLTQFAEEIFEPKRVLTDSDWLKKNREPDQRFEYYKKGQGSSVRWLT